MFLPTKYRTFTHQSIVLSPTSCIVLSPTTPSLKPPPILVYKKRNYARASLTYLTFLTQKLEGALPPLQTTLQESKSKGMRASTHDFLFLVAVTTKSFTSKALLFKPFFLRKTSKKSVINRTLKGKGLDRQMLLQLVCSYAEWRHPTAEAVSCHQSAN